MRKIWLLLLAGITLQCDSDDSSCRLTRYSYNLISYDDQGRVYTVQQGKVYSYPYYAQQFDPDEIVENGFRKVMDYDSDDRISRVREYSGTQLFQYFEIEYQENKIIERKYALSEVTGQTMNSYVTTFNLDSKGKILTIDRIDYTNALPARGRDTYEYDKHGNVTKVVFISQTHPENNFVSEYEFDTKSNPFRTIGFEVQLGFDDIISDRTQNKNNIIRFRTTYTGMDEAPFSETEYKYNDQGYPKDYTSNTSGTPWFDYDCI